jgi:rod shape-determining protein MreC
MINVFGRPIRAPSPFVRLVWLAALSAFLMVLDHRGAQLERLRAALTLLVSPLQAAVSIPVRAATTVADYFQSERALHAEIERLRTQQLLLLARLQQFEALEAENERLRKMLGSAARVADRVLAAEVLEVSTEPYTRKLVVNKGSKDGVYVGQPVIDAQGVVGQVTQVAAHQARITLITDPGHAIPVLVNRTGLRAIAFGTGEAERLRVPHLSHEVDIREGDLLVTSGLGGTFPAGYPVAEVIRVIKDPDEAFLDVRARPLALLAMNQRVLLIWPGARQAQGRQP